MSTNRVLLASVMLALLSAPAFAQGMQPAPAEKSAPAVTKPSTTGTTAPVAAKTNLNTAVTSSIQTVDPTKRTQNSTRIPLPTIHRSVIENSMTNIQMNDDPHRPVCAAVF